MSDKYKKFTKDVGIVAISEAVMRLRPIIFLPILTLYLGVAGYGVYSTLIVTLAFIQPFINLGSNYGVIRMLSSENDKKKISKGIFSAGTFSLLMSFIGALVLFFSASFLANTVFGAPDATAVIQLGAILLIVQAPLTPFLESFRIKRRMGSYSTLLIIYSLGPLLLASIFLLFGMGLYEVVMSFIVVQLSVLIFCVLAVCKTFGPSVPSIRQSLEYVKFGFPMVAGSFSSNLLNLGDRYVIGFFLGASAVGVYSVAYTIGASVSILLNPIRINLLVPLTRAHDEARSKDVMKYLSYSFRYFMLLAIPAAFGLSILATEFTRSMATNEFLAGAAWVTPIVAISTIFLSLFTINSTVFFIEKKVYWNAILLAAFGILNIALNLFLVPTLGLIGAAISTFIAFVGLYISSQIISKKFVKLEVSAPFLLKAVISSIAMAFIVLAFSPSGWIEIILVCGIGALFYFALMGVLKAFSEKEMRFFLSFLKLEDKFFGEADANSI